MSYYKTLGVDDEASPSEIKSAYRRLVKLHHPDRAESAERRDGEAPVDGSRFRAVQEAYEVLSDPDRRWRYDASRRLARERDRTYGRTAHDSWPGGPAPPVPPSGAVPISWTGGFHEPLLPFEEVARRSPGLHGTGAAGLFESARAGLSPSVEIVIGERQARSGGEVSVEVGREEDCPHCRSHAQAIGFFGKCGGCGGAGTVRSFERVYFRVPAGVSSGAVLVARLRNGTSLRARVRVVDSSPTA